MSHKLVWIDITDPKYALFFSVFIPRLEEFAKVLVTTRFSPGYCECKNILDRLGICYKCVGGYGGEGAMGKLMSRLDREREFLALFAETGLPDLFLTGASVEGTNIAFGLGIKIAIFADTPVFFGTDQIRDDMHVTDNYMGDYSDEIHRLGLKEPRYTALSRLCFPLADVIFYPFVLPRDVFKIAPIPSENLVRYNFIDVCLWLGYEPGNDFRDTLGVDKKFSILVREEEFKAHYVGNRSSVIYDAVKLLNKSLDCNIFIMPRYGDAHLNMFRGTEGIFILSNVFDVSEFYPFIDCFIGGGGTMNLEASFLGIPTISTRSLFLYHDLYLLKHGLMHHSSDPHRILDIVREVLNSRRSARNSSPNTSRNWNLFAMSSVDSQVGRIVKHCEKMVECARSKQL